MSASFPADAQLAGSESRPVLSVVRAIFRPWPSSPIRLAAGTRTSWNLVTPFSRPRRPMNALRFSTVTPSALPSTTNAVIPPRRPLPFGTRAMTTSRSATTPLVVHSFTPLSTYSLPSADGIAVVLSLAGSEPTSGSVSRNALISPRAHRGRYFCFCSSVPNSASGCGTPIDWCADSSAASAGDAEPTMMSARL